MNDVLWDILNDSVSVYFDEILIFSTDQITNVQHVPGVAKATGKPALSQGKSVSFIYPLSPSLASISLKATRDSRFKWNQKGTSCPTLTSNKSYNVSWGLLIFIDN